MYESSNLSYQEIFKEFKQQKSLLIRINISILATEIDKSNKDNERRFLKLIQKKRPLKIAYKRRTKRGKGLELPRAKIAQKPVNQVAPQSDQAQPTKSQDTAENPVSNGSSSPTTDNTYG